MAQALQPLQSYSRQWRFSGSIMLMWVNCWLCKAVLLTVLACSVRSDFIIPIRPLFCCWPRNSCQYVPNWSPHSRSDSPPPLCIALLSMCLCFIISINKLSMLQISVHISVHITSVKRLLLLLRCSCMFKRKKRQWLKWEWLLYRNGIITKRIRLRTA